MQTYEEKIADIDARLAKLREASQQWHLKMQFEDPEERAIAEQRVAEISARVDGTKTGALPIKLTKRRRGIGGSETAALSRAEER